MELSLWNRVEVELEITNRICGGVPTEARLIEGWIKAGMPKASEEERAALATKTLEELGDAVEVKAAGMWTTFKRDDDGAPYLEARQINAMLKESANVLRESLIKAEGKADGKRSRFTNLKARIAERLFVETEQVLFHVDDVPLDKVSGSEERAIHVMTAQGPRDALKRTDYVSGPARITFRVRYLTDGVVSLWLIKTLLEHSSYNGLGADRSQGNGRFRVVRVDEI